MRVSHFLSDMVQQKVNVNHKDYFGYIYEVVLFSKKGWTVNPLAYTITNNEVMKFNRTDIVALREQMGRLVDNLSIIYLDIKNTKKTKNDDINNL